MFIFRMLSYIVLIGLLTISVIQSRPLDGITEEEAREAYKAEPDLSNAYQHDEMSENLGGLYKKEPIADWDAYKATYALRS